MLVFLYGSETWTFILREEHRLKAFENMALRRKFGPIMCPSVLPMSKT
jgi:hypothetical protein